MGRLIKTATAETRATDDGFVTPELIDFYSPMAKGGTPLIITGNIYASLDGKSAPRQVGADHDDKIPGLKRLTEAVHAHGSKMFAQLNHCGRQVVPRFAGLAEAVSASAKTEFVTGTRPRALTLVEIEHLVARYADAAERCKKAGFDGIQIHAANGYLMSQFLTPYTNRRTDAYGGSVEGRTRLLREVTRRDQVARRRRPPGHHQDERLGLPAPAARFEDGRAGGDRRDHGTRRAPTRSRCPWGTTNPAFPWRAGLSVAACATWLQGSMSHLRVRPALGLPAVLADPGAGVQPGLDHPAKVSTCATRVQFKRSAVDSR